MVLGFSDGISGVAVFGLTLIVVGVLGMILVGVTDYIVTGYWISTEYMDAIGFLYHLTFPVIFFVGMIVTIAGGMKQASYSGDE